MNYTVLKVVIQVQCLQTCTRAYKLVNLMRCHCDLRKYSFSVRGVFFWNSLPPLVSDQGK